MASQNSGANPLRCNDCGREFGRGEHLRRHRRIRACCPPPPPKTPLFPTQTSLQTAEYGIYGLACHVWTLSRLVADIF